MALENGRSSYGSDCQPPKVIPGNERGWPSDLSGLVGKHIIYTYANGWTYELYYKNETTVDYLVHSGIVAGRWVKDQTASMQQLGKCERRYKVSWAEPTGTCVTQVVDLEQRVLYTTIFFPQWVHKEPCKTVCFQNENLERMLAYRDSGPAYPYHIVDEAGHIHFMEDRGRDNERVISSPHSGKTNTLSNISAH